MTKPTPEEQAETWKTFEARINARSEAKADNAADIKAAGGLASEKTLRDEFAGRAMQGILSGMDLSTMPPYEEFGPFCYRLADAMLEARKTTGEGKS
tara:strand:+ start:188 stop:478 length:291 start_codon:yes stop_codon:yes gene_type:complete